YITLSHCWGNLSDTQKKSFCTSQENLSSRCSGFHVSELPKTFQDAVKVTRALGLSYLWIDSLCIVQSGDNGADWKRESVQMKDIYSQAYMTIAATAAADSLSGFLDRHYQPEYIFVRDKAPLNQRGWVTQEMVLSRRTVYFSPNQMYWTC
ncbi:heterokaryon incompatibility, partial [Plenodomus tracheiphilus IPT5]